MYISVTGDGVVFVNAGFSYPLAHSLHEEIHNITSKRVKFVILENGQGHAALGMTYWQEQGARSIVHEDAAHEFVERGPEILAAAHHSLKDESFLTRLGKPEITFTDKYVIELGNGRIELLNLGPAHSPGDIVTWLPNRKIAISGDMSFHQRMPPAFTAARNRHTRPRRPHHDCRGDQIHARLAAILARPDQQDH